MNPKDIPIANAGSSIEAPASYESHSSLQLFLDQACRHAVFDNDTTLQLVVRAQAGDITARDSLIVHNQKLVVHGVKKYARGKISLDLISEGNMAFLDAIYNFNLESGRNFVLHAMMCIKYRLVHYFRSQNSPIRLPDYMHQRLSELRKIIRTLSSDLGRDPYDGEIISVALKNGIPSPKKALAILRRKGVSLDAPLEGNGDVLRTIADFTPDPSALSPLVVLERSEELHIELNSVEEALDRMSLRDRDKTIFCMYYGLKGYSSRTLQMIGGEFQLTRERIRQIIELVWEKRGLRRRISHLVHRRVM